MIIPRDITPSLIKDSKRALVLAILGPRQSGKTTIARATFANHAYVSLEDFDMRNFALTDPRGFLNAHGNEHGIIIDEIQHVPTILSYIQTIVDLNPRPGYFVLTGSQNFLIMEAVSQTLAGRISLHTLLPLTIDELKKAKLLPEKAEEVIFKGFYPKIYAQDYPPVDWYVDYTKTYIERDVRTINRITDLNAFIIFIKLCAGRIGQVVNLTSLGDDCGISYNTAKAWLSILEASYIIFLLHPHHKNFSKRLIKSPKIYFYDTGLACSLLSIENSQQLYTHYLRGGLFESVIISELYKSFYNVDKVPNLYFWRDHTGNEIDCIIEKGEKLYPIEIKSGKTVNPDYFDNLNYWNNLANNNPADSFIVYAGPENQKRSLGNIISWDNIQEIFKII